MEVMDFNGEGRWSCSEILARYASYAAAMGIVSRDLSPREHSEGGRRWVFPVMEKVIDGIADGDPACVRLGVEFIEEDAKFPFGKTLKSNTARRFGAGYRTGRSKESGGESSFCFGPAIFPTSSASMPSSCARSVLTPARCLRWTSQTHTLLVFVLILRRLPGKTSGLAMRCRFAASEGREHR